MTEVEIEEWRNQKGLPEGSGFRGWEREHGVALAQQPRGRGWSGIEKGTVNPSAVGRGMCGHVAGVLGRLHSRGGRMWEG